MRHKLIAALAVLVLLGGCHRVAVPIVTPNPTATPTPELSAEPKELWGFPIDDTHDAFEVDTNGKLGTVLVTVEQGELLEGEFCDYRYTLSVWDRSDLTTPIQKLEGTGTALGSCELIDANFDGYTDFLYIWNCMPMNWPFGLYIWDEEQGQFVYKTTFWGRGVSADEGTQTISTYVHYTGYAWADETYRWENGELVCFRREEYEALNDELQSVEHVTNELVDGQWQEVSRETYAMQGL